MSGVPRRPTAPRAGRVHRIPGASPLHGQGRRPPGSRPAGGHPGRVNPGQRIRPGVIPPPLVTASIGRPAFGPQSERIDYSIRKRVATWPQRTLSPHGLGQRKSTGLGPTAPWDGRGQPSTGHVKALLFGIPPIKSSNSGRQPGPFLLSGGSSRHRPCPLGGTWPGPATVPRQAKWPRRRLRASGMGRRPLPATHEDSRDSWDRRA